MRLRNNKTYTLKDNLFSKKDFKDKIFKLLDNIERCDRYKNVLNKQNIKIKNMILIFKLIISNYDNISYNEKILKDCYNLMCSLRPKLDISQHTDINLVKTKNMMKLKECMKNTKVLSKLFDDYEYLYLN